MFNKLRMKAIGLALVGTLWLAGHNSCDVGGGYGSFLNSFYPTWGYGDGYYDCGSCGGGYYDYYPSESYYYYEETYYDPYGGYGYGGGWY